MDEPEQLPPLSALDMASKAAGWTSWEVTVKSGDNWLRSSIMAHARTLAKQQAMEARIAELPAALRKIAGVERAMERAMVVEWLRIFSGVIDAARLQAGNAMMEGVMQAQIMAIDQAADAVSSGAHRGKDG